MKKLLFSVMLLAVLSPCTALADDGTMMDLDGLVTYSVDFDKYECELGGAIDYKMTFKNLLPNAVNLQGITCNNEHRYYLDDPIIGVGQMVTLSIEDEIVFPFYQWYPKKDGFYTDIYHYYGFEVGTWEDDFYESYFYEPNRAVPLKITNLNDGSDFVEISRIDEIGFIEFREWELKYTQTDMPYFGSGYSTQTATITNISDKEIKIIGGDYDEITYTTLMPSESIDLDITVEKKADIDKPFRKSELLSFNITFMVDGQYYGAGQQRVYKCKYIPWDADLKFDVTVYDGDYKSLDEAYVFCKIDITNKGLDIPEFMYAFSDENIGSLHEYGEVDLYKDDFQKYGTLTKGETVSVYTRVKKDSDIFGCFASGDTITNVWEYYDLGTSGKKSNYYYIYYDGREFDIPEAIENEIENEETEKEIKQAPEKTEEKQAIEVIAEKPEPAPTLKPPKRIDTERIASMPLWVGIVLGVSLLGSIAIIIALRRKQGS